MNNDLATAKIRLLQDEFVAKGDSSEESRLKLWQDIASVVGDDEEHKMQVFEYVTRALERVPTPTPQPKEPVRAVEVWFMNTNPRPSHEELLARVAGSELQSGQTVGQEVARIEAQRPVVDENPSAERPRPLPTKDKPGIYQDPSVLSILNEAWDDDDTPKLRLLRDTLVFREHTTEESSYSLAAQIIDWYRKGKMEDPGFETRSRQYQNNARKRNRAFEKFANNLRIQAAGKKELTLSAAPKQLLQAFGLMNASLLVATWIAFSVVFHYFNVARTIEVSNANGQPVPLRVVTTLFPVKDSVFEALIIAVCLVIAFNMFVGIACLFHSGVKKLMGV